MPNLETYITVVWRNERALKALDVIAETLADLEEDFGYRDDVKRAVRALRYLAKNVECQVDSNQ